MSGRKGIWLQHLYYQVEQGRIEGRAEEIIQTGYEFGLSEEDILMRLQKKLNVSAQKAQEYLAMFGEKTV